MLVCISRSYYSFAVSCLFSLYTRVWLADSFAVFHSFSLSWSDPYLADSFAVSCLFSLSSTTPVSSQLILAVRAMELVGLWWLWFLSCENHVVDRLCWSVLNVACIKHVSRWCNVEPAPIHRSAINFTPGINISALEFVIGYDSFIECASASATGLLPPTTCYIINGFDNFAFIFRPHRDANEAEMHQPSNLVHPSVCFVCAFLLYTKRKQ